jgi:hypothetical protein
MVMKLKQTAVASAIGLALAGTSLSAQANLTTTTVLSFTLGTSNGPVGSGSWFGVGVDPGNNITVYTPIESFQGIHIGVLQPASGTHAGAPNGTESPSVSKPDLFFANTGLWQIIGTPVTQISHSGNTATLDFRGWDWPWNGIPSIPQSDPANFPGDTGIATMTCSLASCSNTSSYTLDYAGHVPLSHPSGFGGVVFTTHLEGHVGPEPIPLPAALWLFGSGIAGLAAFARRRRKVTGS